MKIKNVNYKKIKRDLIKGICFTLSLGVFPFIYSNIGKNKENHKITFHDNNSIIENGYNKSKLYMIVFDDGRKINEETSLTINDLEHIISATIVVDDNDSSNYDFLNYMNNLAELTIDDCSRENKLANLDGGVFKKDININIYTYSNVSSFNEERYGFLKDIKSINKLCLGNHDLSFNIDSSFLQSLRNVKNLSLGLDFNSNFKYSDLTYLKSLYIDSKPYDACLYFSNEILDDLEKNGVEVSSMDMERFRRANSIIHEIGTHLNIENDASEVEKLNAVLSYVLNHFSYDVELGNKNYHDIEKEELLPFYGKGELTGVFENNSQICGNYAGMVYALCREVGLSCFNMVSKIHAWNAIKIGNYYYFVDATWLDGGVVYLGNDNNEEFHSLYDSCKVEEVFNNNNLDIISTLDWYLEDPIKVLMEDSDAHQASILPEELELLPVPDKVEYFTKEGYVLSKRF